jgi:radical SAM superfamily enzyme YgiQ (UPF0313 family)
LLQVFHVKQSVPRILLLNPWITDFAAYDSWVRPLGLLRIGAFLRRRGFDIDFIDCLDSGLKRRQFGDGKFYKTKMDKPECLRSIPRYYGRYGLSEERLIEKLASLAPPDVIGLTSGMTYWYPGVRETAGVARSIFKSAPIVLGGIYASLCYDHAVCCSGADIVISGIGELSMLNIVSRLTGFEAPSDTGVDCRSRSPLPYPCFDLYPELETVCISTSTGCPFECSYCGSRLLNTRFSRRDPLEVVNEIELWTKKYHVTQIAFYDDALLLEPRFHIVPLLEEILKRGIHCHFHTPNGLHVKDLTEEVAALLLRSGFKTIRLGFETSSPLLQEKTGGKVTNEQFQRAVRNLARAGYSQNQVGAYILAGLPGQCAEEVEETIRYTWESGAKPFLVEYSPVPQTPLFEEAIKVSIFDIKNEPLLQNNSILPCQWEGFTIEDYRQLKLLAKRLQDASAILGE